MFITQDLESNRLTARSLLATDAQRLYEMYSDSEAMKYRGSAPMDSIADAHNMIAEQESSENNLDKQRLALILKSDSALVGTLLIAHNKARPSQCEIGYSFDKNRWNQGLGTELIQMLVEHFSANEQIHSLNAWAKKGNIASSKILARCGFTIKNQDQYPESYLYTKQVNR